MAHCKKCGKQAEPNSRYCLQCLNDPSPVRKAAPAAAKRRTTKPPAPPTSSSLLGLVVLLVVCLLVVWGIRGVYRMVTESPKSGLNPGPPTEPKTQPAPQPAQTKASGTVGAKHITPGPATQQHQSATSVSLEALGAALTEGYKKTPYEVHVFGDSSNRSLSFDCSDDPHPEDTCFMLYRRYPDDSEREFLQTLGVRKLYFVTTMFGKSWQKIL